jgi:hypothetical protein
LKELSKELPAELSGELSEELSRERRLARCSRRKAAVFIARWKSCGLTEAVLQAIRTDVFNVADRIGPQWLNGKLGTVGLLKNPA